MVNKKGAGAIIAWVLLVGFTIGLATTVFLWTTRQTEELTEGAVRFVEGGMQCDNVMINVAVVDPAKYPECGVSCCLKIANTRYLNIEKVILRSLESVETDECCSPLNIKEYAIIDKSGWSGNIEVLPIIKVNDDLVACTNKAITIEC